jgi:hypothetical protein
MSYKGMIEADETLICPLATVTGNEKHDSKRKELRCELILSGLGFI